MSFLRETFRNLLTRGRNYTPYIASEEGFDGTNFITMISNVRQSYAEQNLLGEFDHYCDFIQGIIDLPDTEVVPLKDFFTAAGEGKRLMSLRYDIDADPYTALRMARYNARFGVCGSFYLLHTAYYYGTMSEGVFMRNPLLKEWLLGFVVAGCEIGLHVDAFSLYINFNVDGASAVCEELRWLRAQGAKVFGTVAHNSFPAYGAESFEIFKGRTIWNRRSFEKEGIEIPLGILDGKKIGLDYEGNYARPSVSNSPEEIDKWLNSTGANAAQSEEWVRTYLFENPYCQWGPDVIVWPTNGEKWCMAAKPPDSTPFFKWNISVTEVLSDLGCLPRGTRTSVVIHPIYFSKNMGNAGI